MAAGGGLATRSLAHSLRSVTPTLHSFTSVFTLFILHLLRRWLCCALAVSLLPIKCLWDRPWRGQPAPPWSNTGQTHRQGGHWLV